MDIGIEEAAKIIGGALMSEREPLTGEARKLSWIVAQQFLGNAREIASIPSDVAQSKAMTMLVGAAGMAYGLGYLTFDELDEAISKLGVK